MIKSISGRLSALAAFLVVIAIGIIVFVVVSMTKKSVTAIEKRNMAQMGNQLAENAEMYAMDIKESLQALSSDYTVRESLTNGDSFGLAQSRVRDMLAPFSSYTAIYCFDLSGVVRFGIKKDGSSLVGVNLADRRYIGAVLQGQEYVLSDVIHGKSGGESIIVAAAPVKDKSGKIIGGIAAAVDWQVFVHGLIDNMTVNKTGYPFIVDANGRIIAHKIRSDLMFKDYSGYSFIKDAQRSEDGFIDYAWSGAEKMLYFQHVDKTGWIVFLTVEKEELESTAVSQRNIISGLGILVALILILAIVLSVRSMVLKPIDNVRNYIKHIANGDFSAELEGKFKFEFQLLAEDIKQTVNVLKNKLGFSDGVLAGITAPFVVVDVDEKIVLCNKGLVEFVGKNISPDECINKKLGELVYNDPSKDTLGAKAMQKQEAILNVRASFEDSRGNIKHGYFSASPLFDLDGNLIGAFSMVADITEVHLQQEKIKAQAEIIEDAARQASGIAAQVSSAATELSAQVEDSTSGAENQRSLTSEAATAMEQMNASVIEVARSAEQAATLADASREKALDGKDVVKNVIDMMDQVREKTDILKQDMNILGQHAEGIGSIMTVISDIADQTNLLALNAAIEAARAGDAGRGFAVVADEVRKLAEKTVNATNEVSNYIDSIQVATSKSVSNTEQAAAAVEEASRLASLSGSSLEEIVCMVRDNTDQVRAIATASEEQSAVSEQIARSTEQINGIASETVSTMEQSSAAVVELAKLSSELDQLMNSMVNGD